MCQRIENEKIRSFIAFNPRNYWKDQRGDLCVLLQKFTKPKFITSIKTENEHIRQYTSKVKLIEHQIVFISESEGCHGSRALWESQPEGEKHWNLLQPF